MTIWDAANRTNEQEEDEPIAPVKKKHSCPAHVSPITYLRFIFGSHASPHDNSIQFKRKEKTQNVENVSIVICSDSAPRQYLVGGEGQKSRDIFARQSRCMIPCG